MDFSPIYERANECIQKNLELFKDYGKENVVNQDKKVKITPLIKYPDGTFYIGEV